MAETVVLASLTVDSAGVVTGMRGVDSAIVGTEAKVKSLGGAAQTFVGRLTNVTGALNVMARSLGVLSLGLTAASGIRTLTTDLLNSIPAWKQFTGALEETYNWLVKNETAVTKLNRGFGERAKDFFALLGLAGRGVNVGPLAAGMRAGDEQAMLDTITVGPFDTRRVGLSDRPAGGGDLESMAAASRELARSFEDIAAVGPFDDVLLPDAIMESAFSLEYLVDSFDKVKEGIVSLPGVVEATAPTLSGAFSDWASGFTLVTDKLDILVATLSQAGNLIADAFLEGGIGFKSFVTDILKGIARMAIVKAIFYTAEGLAFLASFNFGSAALSFQAAKLMAGIGIGTGLGSIALGGRGGGRERGERDAAREVGGGGTAQASRNPNVTVVVQGSLLGSDPNELARSIQRLLMTAQQDGA